MDRVGAGRHHPAIPSLRRPARHPLRLTSDARRVVGMRGLRGLLDGLVSVVLPAYLTVLGFSAVEIGLISTATLVGSAVLTLSVALGAAGAWSRRALLMAAGVAMVATGVGYATFSGLAALLLVGFLGTLNPTSGDVSVFLPTEQAMLPQTVADTERTALFARYALVGTLAAAGGALGAGVPNALAEGLGWSEAAGGRLVFALYSAAGVVVVLVYRRLSPGAEPAQRPPRLGAALRRSRRVVLRLSALFSLDAFAGGFTVQSMLALWLFRRFELSLAAAGLVFFWSGLAAAASMPLSARLARRIGLVNTMVFTHLPAQGLLAAAALAPTAPAAVTLLVARSFLSTMDVPARTSYVMAVVPPEERSAAAGVTNVPRSLAAAAGPVLAGWMLSRSTFGWPLLVAAALKATYDVLLLVQFRSVRPPEEQRRRAPDPPPVTDRSTPPG